MKILHIEAGMHLYGGALQVSYLIRQLSAKGHENLLVCAEQAALVEVCNTEADICQIPMKGDLDFLLVRRLGALITQSKPDLIHVHSRRGADIWGLIAAKHYSVPCVVTRRVDNREPGWFASRKYSAYDQVVVISEAIRMVLIQQGLEDEQIITIPSAVDCDLFKPQRHNRVGQAHFYRRFGLNEDDLIIGVIAQLIERKGHNVLFDALPIIIQRYPNTHLVLFGRGPKEAELKRQCDAYGYGDSVIFAGFCNDMHNIIPYLNLVVHPAYKEGLGVALLQASACGIPIVASDAGGIPEVVLGGENGQLVSPGDQQELAGAILGYLGQEEAALSAGIKGREMVKNKFSIEQMAHSYEAVYQSVLS